MAGLDEQLRLLRGKRITFEHFMRATAGDWRRMAAKLYRIWELPSGVTEEDVEQEMVLAAWRAVQEWDPTMPNAATLRGYVVWTAHNTAAKWLHSQRRAKRRDGRSPSRHARAVGGMAIDPQGELSPNELLDLFGSVPAEQETTADVRAVLRLIPECATTERGELALRAWVMSEGDVEEAGRELFDDPALRLRYEWGWEGDATRVVRRELRTLREVLQIEEA